MGAGVGDAQTGRRVPRVWVQRWVRRRVARARIRRAVPAWWAIGVARHWWHWHALVRVAARGGLTMSLQLRAHVALAPHASGRFDHGDVHVGTGRVFVAHTAS